MEVKNENNFEKNKYSNIISKGYNKTSQYNSFQNNNPNNGDKEELIIDNENAILNNDIMIRNHSLGQGVLNRKISKFFFRKFGNTFTFFGDKEGSPLIVIGPHWPIFLFVFLFVVGGYIIFLVFCWSNLNIYIKVIGFFVIFSFIISYSLTALINPGIPKFDENAIIGQPREQYKYCEYCKIWVNKNKKIEHCFECNICIEGLDHHCPWTGKCIGRNNIIYFYSFLVSILLVFFYFVIALMIAQNHMFDERKKRRKKIK